VSIDVIAREIARFLRSTDPEVLCLKGKWGVGKTFAWQRYILNAKSKGEIGLERYAFVSLYGVSSVDQLRLSIVENTIKREQIGQEIDLQSMLTDPFSSAQGVGRKLLSKIGYVPWGKDLAALIQLSSFLTVRKQVICLDDLERKGDALKIKEVLGLASFLKEQRDCKVVLILNDGAFEPGEQGDFETFSEKTVDSHVTSLTCPNSIHLFAPAAPNSVSQIFASSAGSSEWRICLSRCLRTSIPGSFKTTCVNWLCWVGASTERTCRRCSS
jgi:hypothetical protein